jgi:hypothetical protein
MLELVVELTFAFPSPKGADLAMNDNASPSGPSVEVPRFAARSMMSPGLQAVLKASTDAAVRPLMAEVSKAFLGASLSKTFLGGGVPKAVLGVGLPRPELGGFAKLAGGTMASPGLQAALKASTEARVRPLMADLSWSVPGAAMPKVFMGDALSKAFLGAGVSKAVLGDFGKLAGRPMVSPGLQAVLKARTDAAFRPLMADLFKSTLGAAMPKGLGAEFAKLVGGSMVGPGLRAALNASTDARLRPLIGGLSKSVLGAGPRPALGAEFAKLAARPVFNAVIDVPAGRTLSERARFTDLLGQAAKQWPAGTDGQAALADLAQRQAERQAVAHEADQAIVELRDQFEQLVTILQVAQQDQRHEARVNRRLAIATLAATILLPLLLYLLPPRSVTTSPTPTVPPPSVTSPSREGSTPRQVPPGPSKPQKPRSDTT